MRNEMIEYTTITVPITLDNLPDGLLWEADGACWKAIPWGSEPKGWRWQPMNWAAFAKEGQEGEMTDFPPDAALSPAPSSGEG
ncbi:MAG: hypothetical protein JWN66_4989 [Sphingomonas bacterium]|nr:hypothetical protein [Sphingomonas bacterium]